MQHSTRTNHKDVISEATRLKLAQLLGDDYIFYKVVKQRFYFLLNKFLKDYL